MTTPTTSPGAKERLYFLDWLRIGAFALLVLFHVGMYYVGWDWHVKSPHASGAIEPLMRLTAPWRLSLLFLLSGAATALMLRRDGGATGTLLGSRVKRLALPLLLGIAVIVPPQAYFEVVQHHAYSGSYLDFLRRYFSGYDGFCRAGGGCLILPTWNHLWFVAYLLVYTVALWSMVRFAPHALDRLAAVLQQSLRGPWLLLAPIGALALLRLTLLDHFPPTHALVGDWYLHASYAGLFVVGAAIARPHGAVLWQRMMHARWSALAVALIAWLAGLAASAWLSGRGDATAWAGWPRLAFATMQWSAIVAAIGFARRHLNRDYPARRTLTDAVFPVYIVHQTWIIVLAMAFARWHWPVGTEAALLVAGTFVLSWISFEGVRRVAWLRPWFGLARRDAAARSQPVPASAEAASR